MDRKDFGVTPSWYAVDRTIDFNTGLQMSSRDPAGTEIHYHWDSLGRLTTISPTAPDTEMKPIHADPRPGDIRQSMADITMARRDLGYEPRVAFPEGLERSIEYYRSVAERD